MVTAKIKRKSSRLRFTPKVPKKALAKISNFVLKSALLKISKVAPPEAKRFSKVPKNKKAIPNDRIKRFFLVAKKAP